MAHDTLVDIDVLLDRFAFHQLPRLLETWFAFQGRVDPVPSVDELRTQARFLLQCVLREPGCWGRLDYGLYAVPDPQERVYLFFAPLHASYDRHEEAWHAGADHEPLDSTYTKDGQPLSQDEWHAKLNSFFHPEEL